MTWKERARRARLSHVFIANALGYSNGAKVSQAFTWEVVPVAIRLLIVLAEGISTVELERYINEIETDRRHRAAMKEPQQ